jgi:hypothetical protein
MASLILTYWLWFLIAGAVGMAAGWILRESAHGARITQIKSDIEHFEAQISRVRAARRGEPAPVRPTVAS